MSAQAAKRRRRQAVKQYRHLSPLRRPKYSKMDIAKSRRREAKKAATRQRMTMKPKK